MCAPVVEEGMPLASHNVTVQALEEVSSSQQLLLLTWPQIDQNNLMSNMPPNAGGDWFQTSLCIMDCIVARQGHQTSFMPDTRAWFQTFVKLTQNQ